MSIKKFFALLFIVSLAVFLCMKFKSITVEEKTVQQNKTTQTYTQKSHMPSISVENNFSSDDNFILLSSLMMAIN